MPETTSDGRRGSSFTIARFTQSAGVPSTAKTLGSTFSARSGCLSVSDCELALASRSGATSQISPSPSSAGRERADSRRVDAVVVRDQDQWRRSWLLQRTKAPGRAAPGLLLR